MASIGYKPNPRCSARMLESPTAASGDSRVAAMARVRTDHGVRPWDRRGKKQMPPRRTPTKPKMRGNRGISGGKAGEFGDRIGDFLGGTREFGDLVGGNRELGTGNPGMGN